MDGDCTGEPLSQACEDAGDVCLAGSETLNKYNKALCLIRMVDIPRAEFTYDPLCNPKTID